MSWRQFIASVLQTLTWPTVALVALVMLRKRLNELLGSGSLRRLKAGPVEAEWDEVAIETQAAVEVSGVLSDKRSEGGESAVDPIERLRSLAEDNPALAVLGGHQLVLAELREIAGPMPRPARRLVRGISEYASIVQNMGLIGSVTVEAIDGLRQLRNIAAHQGEVETIVTPGRALQYLDLAAEVLRMLEHANFLKEHELLSDRPDPDQKPETPSVQDGNS